MVPQQPPFAPGTLDLLHVCITLGLFVTNFLLTQMINRDGVLQRLKYIGHEMVFLAMGLVAARMFLENLAVVLLAMGCYLVLWVLTLWLTQQVIDKKDVLQPQVPVTVLLGLVSVYLSVTSFIELKLNHLLSGYR